MMLVSRRTGVWYRRVPMHRSYRGLELGLVLAFQVQGRDHTPRRVAVWVRGAALQFLDPVHAQTRLLGQLLLRQACRLPVVT
jgi:hypothetical protein